MIQNVENSAKVNDLLIREFNCPLVLTFDRSRTTSNEN